MCSQFTQSHTQITNVAGMFEMAGEIHTHDLCLWSLVRGFEVTQLVVSDLKLEMYFQRLGKLDGLYKCI